MRRLLTWEPPLWVVAMLLLGVTTAVSYAMTGALSPLVLVLSGCAFGAQVARRRRMTRQVP